MKKVFKAKIKIEVEMDADNNCFETKEEFEKWVKKIASVHLSKDPIISHIADILITAMVGMLVFMFKGFFGNMQKSMDGLNEAITDLKNSVGELKNSVVSLRTAIDDLEKRTEKLERETIKKKKYHGHPHQQVRQISRSTQERHSH